MVSRFYKGVKEGRAEHDKWAVRKAERRLKLWGHEVLRIGYHGSHYKVDGEICDESRLIYLSQEL